MGTDKHIKTFIASMIVKDYARADRAIQATLKEMNRAKFNREYSKIKKEFFGK